MLEPTELVSLIKGGILNAFELFPINVQSCIVVFFPVFQVVAINEAALLGAKLSNKQFLIQILSVSDSK